MDGYEHIAVLIGSHSFGLASDVYMDRITANMHTVVTAHRALTLSNANSLIVRFWPKVHFYLAPLKQISPIDSMERFLYVGS